MNTARARLFRLLTGCLLALLVIGVYLTPWGQRIEHDVGLRWLYAARGVENPPDNIIIVSMNSEAARALDQPEQLRLWDRALHAELINQLTFAGADLIIMDIFFHHPRDPQSDFALAQAMKQSQRTVMSQFVQRARSGNSVYSTLLKPANTLQNTASGLGPFPLPKDHDHVSHYWLFHDDTGGTPTLPMVSLYLLVHRTIGHQRLAELFVSNEFLAKSELPTDTPDANSTRHLIETLRSQLRNDSSKYTRYIQAIERIPNLLAKEAQLLRALGDALVERSSRNINFYGPGGTIKTVPYPIALQADDELRELFNGAVVLVGSSALFASTQLDGFPTVFTSDDSLELPGVEIAATVLV